MIEQNCFRKKVINQGWSLRNGSSYQIPFKGFGMEN